MGSCVSSMREQTPQKLNMSSFGSKSHDLVIPPTPIKEKPPHGFPPINDWPALTGRGLGMLSSFSILFNLLWFGGKKSILLLVLILLF